MAEEFVRMEHFTEFVKRMDERFDHVNELAEQRYDSINQRLADAEKAREQNVFHVNQRFDDVNQRFDDVNQRLDDVNQRFDDLQGSIGDIRADLRQMRNWLVWLFGLVVFGFIGSIVLILLRGVFQ